MGTKRSRADMEGRDMDSPQSPFMPMFDAFRAELDEHHDRRERIIKASRDITAASKKIIFTLQRVRKLNEPLPQHVVKGNKPYYDIIGERLASVSKDLQGLNAWRYARQISGGCQEFVEAASFELYLTTASLLTYEDASAQLVAQDKDGPGIELSAEDYLLGIFDMTGELMRFAITTMATGGSLPSIASDNTNLADMPTFSERNVLHDLRALRSALESLNAGQGPFAKEAEKKMDVMKTSVEKVERSLYGLVVRGAERPKGWLPDADRSIEVEG